MKGLIIKDACGRYQFIQLDAISTVKQSGDGFDIFYGKGGSICSEKQVEYDELLIMDYEDYLIKVQEG